MRKLISVLTAAALCAALLAGCGDADRSGADTANGGTATAAPGAADDTAPNDTVPGTAGEDDAAVNGGAAGDAGTAAGEGAGTDASGAAYSAEGLNTALDGILTVGADAAGGSLQTAQAAARLVEFAAACGTGTATLGADAKAWLEGLTDADREMLKQNWAAVRDRARSISENYDDNKDMLGDAGVTTDFSALDMSGVDAFLNTVDSILGI